MPQLGNGVDSVVIEEWMFEVGEAVTAGDAIVLVETDKASMELESPTTGILAAVIAPDGTEVQVGDVIAEFERSA
jgi:pyruvate/2-oxoglutarate dehydrogenase complex dihydrolipoamide acyltransferase (E2) component